MQLDAFLKLRDELRTTRPELIDLSELNLYRTLAFPAIAPSAPVRPVTGRSPSAQHRMLRGFDRKHLPKMKDPSGGTTGRVKAIWALGVDGRSRLI